MHGAKSKITVSPNNKHRTTNTIRTSYTAYNALDQAVSIIMPQRLQY